MEDFLGCQLQNFIADHLDHMLLPPFHIERRTVVAAEAILFCCTSRSVWTVSRAKSKPIILVFVHSFCKPHYKMTHVQLISSHLKVTNEESLKHLSAYLESVQNQQWPSTLPKFISFYVREKNVKGKRPRGPQPSHTRTQ